MGKNHEKKFFAKKSAVMSTHGIVYIVFAVVLVLALTFDLGLLSKKNKTVTIKQALYQTLFWVALALVFFVFMWIEGPALQQKIHPVVPGAVPAKGAHLHLNF
jgi:hypothetical protein